MDPAIGQFLTSIGLTRYIELAGVIVMICSALDASIPQPAAGSHWLPLRKALSWFALNVSNAKPGGQPTLASWLLRIAQAVMAAGLLKAAQDKPTQPVIPTPAPVAPPAVPVVPLVPVLPLSPPVDPAPPAPAAPPSA